MEGFNDFTNSLNQSFYFVTDKLIELQRYFIGAARGIAYVVLLIAICSAAVNYALTGTGLKENIVKTLKAVVFYAIVLFAYPTIVSWITSYTFELARDSTYAPMQAIIKETQKEIVDKAAAQAKADKQGTAGDALVNSRLDYFDGMIHDRVFTTEDGNQIKYSTVAPVAVLRTLLLVAGECFHFSDKSGAAGLFADFGAVIKGIFCGFFIIFTGVFALLEYLIAFMEFMFISSVGIILFPFSLWEGSKFIAEKFIGAMLGFFIKLLLCTVCIFLMLYGYLSLARQFSADGFAGNIEQIIVIVFSSLLYFFLSRSAPGLAQSLLTGTPSLNAAGAISAAKTAATAVAAGTAAVAGGTMNVAGAVAQGSGALSAGYGAARAGGHSVAGSVGAGLAAFGKSMAGSALDTVKDKGSELTRSLLGQKGGGAGSAGHNDENHESATSKYGRTLKDGDGKTKHTLAQTFGEKREAGKVNFAEAQKKKAANAAKRAAKKNK